MVGAGGVDGGAAVIPLLLGSIMEPIQYARHYRLMVVPVSYGGDYAWEEARPATLVDLALAGVRVGDSVGSAGRGKDDSDATP